MERQLEFIVGIDWASKKHDVALLRLGDGKWPWEVTIPNTPAQIVALLAGLTSRTAVPAERVGIAIERPDGPLVGALMAGGYRVFSINPLQLKHYRLLRGVSGAKDDRRDAKLLAEALSRIPESFREVAAIRPECVMLSALVRAHSSMVEDRKRSCAKLREVLELYYPQILHISSELEYKWVAAVFEAAPTPKAASRLKLAQVQAILSKNSGRRSRAQEILDVLHGAKLAGLPAHDATLPKLASYLFKQVGLSRDALKDVEEQMAATLKELHHSLKTEASKDGGQGGYSDVEIIGSLPAIGPKTQASLFGFAPNCIALKAEESLRCLAGIAPVTVASGTSLMVKMRRTSHGTLRNAFHLWALGAIRADEHFRSIFVRSRSRGHSVGASLRRVADALLRTLFGLLRTRTLYDPNHSSHREERHQAPSVDEVLRELTM